MGRRTHIPTRLATRDAYTDMYPGHPDLRRSASRPGSAANANTFEHFIAVNQVGKRFFNDMDLMRGNQAGSAFPGGNNTPGTGRRYRSGRLAQLQPRPYPRHVQPPCRARRGAGDERGLARPRTIISGPLWAIFDQGAVERAGLDLRPPFVAEDNGYFFSADTLEELQEMINEGHQYQRVPDDQSRGNGRALERLCRCTARTPISAAARMRRCTGSIRPRFYAASIVVVWHDSYGGLRINGKCQVARFRRRADPGSLCRLRSLWRRQSARSGSRPGAWLYRRHQRGRGNGSLIIAHR